MSRGTRVQAVMEIVNMGVGHAAIGILPSELNLSATVIGLGCRACLRFQQWTLPQASFLHEKQT